MWEATYLLLERPPPYCSITGGNERDLNRKILTIDGFTQSYDAELGAGQRDRVNFTLACFRYLWTSIPLHCHQLVIYKIVRASSVCGTFEGQYHCDETRWFKKNIDLFVVQC